MSEATGVRDGTLAGGLPYLAIGAGTPLLYIPGGTFEHRNPTGLARAIALSTVRPFARAGFEVYLVNRRPGLPADVTMADVAADYATAIRARFGGGPVDVIGHSTGGSIVLQLIADHPEAVRRAVVASAAYRLGPVAKRAQREMARRLSAGRPGFHLLAPGFTRNPLLIRVIAAAMWTAGLFVRVRDPADLNAMTDAEDAFDVHDRLPGITTPTLVVHGGRDHFWTPEMFADTARRMPYGRLLTYPAAGHGVNVHRRFFADVIAFLRDGGSRPATGGSRPGG